MWTAPHLDIARQLFYRAANAIISKVGRHASDEIILQLISNKCMLSPLVWTRSLSIKQGCC